MFGGEYMVDSYGTESDFYRRVQEFFTSLPRDIEADRDTILSAHIVVYSQKSIRVLDMRRQTSIEDIGRHDGGHTFR